MITQTTMLAPTVEKERFPLLDVLRGFAIFGILLNNMGMFSGASREPGFVGTPPTTMDVTVESLIMFFINGKSYMLFSLLFGLGFALQLKRAEARGTNLLPAYSRRLLLLFAIGALHTVLLWEGDILAMYALLGFCLLPIRRWPSWTLLAGAGMLLIMSPVAQWFSSGLNYAVDGVVNAAATGAGGVAGSTPAEIAQSVYGHGRYLDVVAYRLDTLPYHIERMWLNQSLGTMAIFLFGLYAGRHRFVETFATHAMRLRAWLPWVFVAAVVVNLMYIFALMQGRLRLELVSLAVGGLLLCIVYVGGLGLLMEKPVWRARLAPLAAVGRVALTNYLLQSAICTTLFYGYGFGLYGQFGSTSNFLVAFIVFTCQIVLSTWWLRRFHFGPIEWLWRMLTYGQWQPLKKAVRV